MKINFRYIAAAALVMLVLLPLGATARDRSESRAQKEIYTPKAGDFSFGVDMLPIIDFMGNVFNNTADQSLDELSGSPVSISRYSNITAPTASILGRYMLTDELGLRVNLGLIVDNSNDTAYVTDDAAIAFDALSEAEVVDVYRSVKSGASLAVGLERRVGKGRVQGVFSGNVLYMYSIENESYTYGNAITSINQTPTSAYSTSLTSVPSYMSTVRTLTDRGGATHTLGLMATAGIEWFVASQVSIGFEVDIIAAYSMIGQTHGEYEGYNTAAESVTTYIDTTAPATHEFYLNTGCFSSNFTLNFYF